MLCAMMLCYINILRLLCSGCCYLRQSLHVGYVCAGLLQASSLTLIRLSTMLLSCCARCCVLSEKEQRIQTALENVGQIWPNNARLHLFPAHSTSCRVTTQPLLLVSSLSMSSMFPSLVFPYTTLDQKKCKPHHLLLSRFQTLNVLSLKCRLIFLQASD